jgi:hypothetical protein
MAPLLLLVSSSSSLPHRSSTSSFVFYQLTTVIFVGLKVNVVLIYLCEGTTKVNCSELTPLVEQKRNLYIPYH